MHGKYSPTPRKNKPSSSHSASSHSMANMNSLSCASLFTTLLLFLLLTNIEAAAPRRSLSAGDTAAQFLNPHNALRARLGLPPLQWDKKLVSYAKSYANQRRGDCALEHSTGNYGENLFWGKGKGWKISDAVAAWAAEQKYYNYNQNSCQPDQDCTHYTQMVWRTTQRIGCAKIICNSGDTFIICNYDPHGNIIGARPY